MKSKLHFLWLLIVAPIVLVLTSFQNCTGFQSVASFSSSTGVSGSALGRNTLPVTVDGCGFGYANDPCVSVTICTPGTSQCVTVNNIILDTGSTGLRIFKSALGGLNFPQVTSPTGGALAECYEYGDGTYGFWGQVQTADVMLGGEKASNVPIHVVDPTLTNRPSNCQLGQLTTPEGNGGNGVMGVMSYTLDCGTDCASDTTVGLYYSCSGSTCTPSTVPVANQVPNPVALMPYDNNGYIIQLPNVSTDGTGSAFGTMTLGIGTQANNTPPASVSVVPLNSAANSTLAGSGFFGTNFNGVNYASAAFLDSGTPYYNLQATPTLPVCTATSISGFLCPTSTQSLTAELESGLGANVTQVPFQIENAAPFETSTTAVPNVGVANAGVDSGEGGLFIWGLPFFFGKSVYVGLENKTSSLGIGQLFGFTP